MKLSIREGMVPGETLQDRLAWVERIGLEGIELHAGSMAMDRDELRRVMADSPIEVSAVEGIPKLVDADPAVRDAAKAEIRARLELAGQLGAVGVLIVPQFGRTPALPDLSPWKSGADLERELLVAQLTELAPDAAAAGVCVFTEPLNRYEAYIVNRVADGAAIGREVGNEVRTMADFFHMNIEEPDIAASIREAGDAIVYVHVADSTRAQPGQGHLDFAPGFAALKEIGYDGWLGIECSRIVGDIDTAITDAAALIRKVWDEA